MDKKLHKFCITNILSIKRLIIKKGSSKYVKFMATNQNQKKSKKFS